MNFKPIHLCHRQRAPWSAITHVRLKAGLVADSIHGQRVLDHIKSHADCDGVAPITQIAAGFPARKGSNGATSGMRYDLRHMANARDAGESQQDKGLLELGWLE